MDFGFVGYLYLRTFKELDNGLDGIRKWSNASASGRLRRTHSLSSFARSWVLVLDQIIHQSRIRIYLVSVFDLMLVFDFVLLKYY